MKEKFISYILDEDILINLSDSQKDILHSYLLTGNDFDKLEQHISIMPFHNVRSLDSIAKEYKCIKSDGVPDNSDFGIILDRYLLFLSKNAPMIFFRKMVSEGDEALYPYTQNLTMRYSNYIMPALKGYSMPIYDDVESENNDDTDWDTDDEDMDYDDEYISDDSDDDYIDLADCDNIDEFRYGLYSALIDKYGKKEVISCLKSINAGNKIIDYVNSIILEDEIRCGKLNFHEFFINLIVYNKSTDKIVDFALICYLKMNVDINYHSKDAKIYEMKLIPTENIIDNILSHNIPSVTLFKFLFYNRLFGECFGDLNYYNYFYMEDKCFLKLVDRFIDDSDTMYNYAVELLSKDTHKILDNGEYRREWKYVTLEVYGAFAAVILFKFANLNKKQTDTILSLLDNFFINKARNYYYGTDFQYEIYNQNETNILKLTDNFNILKNGEYKPLFRVIKPETGYYYMDSHENNNFNVDHIAILSVAFLWSMYSKTAKNYFVMSSSASSILKRINIELPFVSYLFNVFSRPYKMNLYEYLHKELHLEPIELYKISVNKSGKERVEYKLEFYDRNMYIHKLFAYTKNEPEVLYDILKTKGLSIKEYEYIIDETYHKYPEIYDKKYIANLLYALSNKDYIHFIPYFTENKEYIKDEVKKVAENEKGSAKTLAMSLMALIEDDNIPSSKEDIILYTKEHYEKSMDKKLPFVKELDYGRVLFKDSNENVPDYTLKYVVYEYFTYVNLEITKLSLNLYKLVDIVSFNKFLDSFYRLWEENGEYTKKYKNMAILYTVFKDKPMSLQKDIEYLYSSSRISIGKLFISAMALRNDDYGLLILDRLNRKSKDKKLRKDCLASLQLVADNRSVSLDELYDEILPDFGFNNRREIVFNYGIRKVKVMLNNDFKLILEDENGNLLKAIPSYSLKYNDDEEMVKTVKEEYQYIKKQVPLSIEEWSIRLLQAALLEKKYSKNKWINMFINNPLLNIYATKLIWQSYDSNGNLLNSFRVTEDGYFVTNEDEDININNADFLTILTPYNSSSEIIDKWRKHIEDYEIEQSFNQLDLPNNSENNINMTLFKDKKYKITYLKKVLEKFGFKPEYDQISIYEMYKTITQYGCVVSVCFKRSEEYEENYWDYDYGHNIEVEIDNIAVNQADDLYKQCEDIPQPVFNFIAYIMINYLLIDKVV